MQHGVAGTVPSQNVCIHIQYRQFQVFRKGVRKSIQSSLVLIYMLHKLFWTHWVCQLPLRRIGEALRRPGCSSVRSLLVGGVESIAVQGDLPQHLTANGEQSDMTSVETIVCRKKGRSVVKRLHSGRQLITEDLVRAG
jgi:hypothetical protein